ncbi:MAG: glycosyltransferase family 2 protein [Bacteroidota bacterium]
MISALAITYNEEHNIERFIKSLDFVDEIIIVDSHSTDSTAEMAQDLGAKVIKRKFTNYSDQKNYALDQAKNNWVVFFDLDETIPKSLAEELKTVSQLPDNIVAYKVKREFYFMGKQIKYSGFQNDWVFRLFDKRHCKFNDSPVHEQLLTNGPTARLENISDHYTYKNFDHYNQKLTKYAKLQAEQLYKKNLRPNLYHFLFRPWYRFFHQYIIKLGFLDGKEGFILAYLNGFSVFKRYLQLWLMYRNID